MGVTAVSTLPADIKYWHSQWMLQRRDKVSDARLAADETRWRKYVAPTFKDDRAVTRITRAQLEAWVEKIRDQAGVYTIEAAVMTLRQVLDLAVEGGALKANPAKALVVGAPAGIEAVDEASLITTEQFEAIVAEIQDDYSALVRLAGETGCLWKEALGVGVSDIDFKSRSIRIGCHEIVETNGTTEVAEMGIEAGRVMAISPALSSALADLVLATQDRRTEDYDWVFLTTRDHVHPLRSNFNRFIWRPALEKAGVNPRAFTFHDLRHYAAAQMLRNGMDLESVSRRMGHKHLRTTASMYGHLVPDED